MVREPEAAQVDSFEYLYTECFRPIYRYLFFRVRDADLAMDLTQDVFVKAHVHFEKLDHETSLRYLYTAARNTLIDHFRRAGVVGRSSSSSSFDDVAAMVPDETLPGIEHVHDIALDMRIVMHLLGELSDAEQEVVVMRYMDERDYSEIAIATGKIEENVRQLLSRGMKKLRAAYEAYQKKYEQGT